MRHCYHNSLVAIDCAWTAVTNSQNWASRIGFPSTSPNLLAAFRQGLRTLGYIEGQNVFFVSRYGEGKEERLPQLADELVQYGVDVIFAIGRRLSLLRRRRTRYRSYLSVVVIRSR